MKKVLIILLIIISSITYAMLHQDYRELFNYWYNVNSTSDSFKEKAISEVKENKQLIKEIAKEHGLDPIVIAGIIYTENCLNQSPANYFEDYYIKEFILSKTDSEINQIVKETINYNKNSYQEKNKIINKINNKFNWSLGLCQISIIRAIEIENKICNNAKRYPRTNKEIIISLLNKRENLRYCALDLLLIKKSYKNILNIDLDGKPEILVTAYNIGRLNNLIEQHKNSIIKNPHTNSFGDYFLSHVYEVKALLDT